jgi:ABC-type transporter Mla maintaining outer membrane lipid asymmetry ATPase subunit MlaF
MNEKNSVNRKDSASDKPGVNEKEVVVRARNVHKAFGSNKVLNGVDVDVHKGEVLCIMGPSGSGKSTFLRCINHLEKINAGEIVVTAISWAIAVKEISCTNSPRRVSLPNAATSGWCSSTSISSRT